MRPSNILFINQTSIGAQSDLLPILEGKFVTHCIYSCDHIQNTIQAIHPDIICFEFEDPDPKGLITLRKTRIDYPSIPVLMVTNNSSEALVTWALRARVWDYLTKPVEEDELLKRFHALYNVISNQVETKPRQTHLPFSALPADVRHRIASSSRVIQGVLHYIERNLSTKISQDTVAAACGMSPCQFSRNFKKICGTTFQDYLMKRRLREATKLLRNTNASISDVCYTTGFNDMSHFCRTFRRYVGMTPSRYKRASQPYL